MLENQCLTAGRATITALRADVQQLVKLPTFDSWKKQLHTVLDDLWDHWRQFTRFLQHVRNARERAEVETTEAGAMTNKSGSLAVMKAFRQRGEDGIASVQGFQRDLTEITDILAHGIRSSETEAKTIRNWFTLGDLIADVRDPEFETGLTRRPRWRWRKRERIETLLERVDARRDMLFPLHVEKSLLPTVPMEARFLLGWKILGEGIQALTPNVMLNADRERQLSSEATSVQTSPRSRKSGSTKDHFHTPEQPRPAEYKATWMLDGTQIELAYAIDRKKNRPCPDRRVLLSAAEHGRVWAVRLEPQFWQIYFKNEIRYLDAKERLIQFRQQPPA